MSPNYIESLKVYFDRLAFYRNWFTLIPFQRWFFEKLKMQSSHFLLFQIRIAVTQEYRLSILCLLRANRSMRCKPKMSPLCTLKRLREAGSCPGSQTLGWEAAMQPPCVDGVGVRLHATRVWACAPTHSSQGAAAANPTPDTNPFGSASTL